MAKREWTKLGKEKLASSTLTTKQADALGMYEVASAKTLHASFEALPALVLPYFDFNGRPHKFKSSYPDFYRLRYLAKGTGFADMATDAAQRYAQEPGSGICAYLPKSREWDKIAADTREPIILTEGELKAAAGCAAGYNVAGLGGVWNFRSYREGVLFLPELDKIDWRRRTTYICYDSDYISKPQVCFAINALSEELDERGADVRVILLPGGEEEKCGMDDFLMTNSPEDFDVLMAQAQKLGVARELWRMNKQVLYVKDPGMVIEYDSGLKMQPGGFIAHSEWAALNTLEYKIDAKGSVSYTKTSAAAHWIKWPLRRYVQKVTYRPGKPRITDENHYNQWAGWGVQPKKGDIKPFLELFEFIFQDLDKEHKEWVLDWMAYPIQNPGVKMFAAVVVHGVAQGTGKSQIGYTLGDIYGTNFKEITNDDLEDGQTWWAENKQFIMGDEITGNDNRAYASQLKRLITQEEIKINIKFVPQYSIPDCINYYFTAQHGDAFFLEDADRRYFINEVTNQPLHESFYKRYHRWRKEEGGPAALMHWLMERKISKAFDPFGKAPDTSAKRRMILAGKGDLGRWIADMLENPSQFLVNGQLRHARDLFTASELLSMYKTQYPEGKATPIGMGRALANAGCPQVANGQPLRGPDGHMSRYFAVRHRDTWAKSKDRKKMEANIATPVVRRAK